MPHRFLGHSCIWTKEKAEYHGKFVNFDPTIARPKPVQKPHPPIHVGGAFPLGARRTIRMAMAGFRRPAAISCSALGDRVRPAFLSRGLPRRN